MSNAMFGRFAIIGFLLLLSACASVPNVPDGSYSKTARSSLYATQGWHLEGRLALSSPKDSWSANVIWRHRPDSENLKLSGPLGQGAVAIELAGGTVKIDRGGGDVQTSDQPEDFINQQLGLFVPLESLRFWVVGLPDSADAYQPTTDGFVQGGWLVEYKAMQKAGDQSVPQKMIVSKDRFKLKLLVDQLDLKGYE